MSNNDRTIRPYLRSGPPGSGKTSSKVNELKKTKARKIILGPSHDYLSEQEVWIPNSKHWWGLSSENGCPCLKESEDSKIPEKEAKRRLIQRLVYLKFTYDYVCTACKDICAYPQEDCPYKKQFDNIKSFPFVLAPIAYAFTKRIDEYDPQEIVVDDCVKCEKVHPKRDLLEFQLQFLTNLTNRYQKIDSKISLPELNNRPDYDSFMKKLEKAYKKNINKLVEQAKDKNWKEISSDYDEKFLVSPSNIDTYCKLARVHGYQEQFATPALFYLFDYIIKKKEEGKDVKLTIIDAKPNINFLKTLSDRYFKEKGVKINFVSDDEFEPKLVDRGSVVYQMTSRNSWYPRASIKQRETKARIKKMIEWIMEYFYDNNPNQKIGIIIWKPKNSKWLSKEVYNKRLNYKMRLYIPERFKNVEIETHGNVRGKNSLEECDPLFDIGTYVINKNNIGKQFVHWHGYKPATLETVEKEPHGSYYHYVDEDLDTFRRQLEEIEVYQEIHRSRLWLSKKRVFVFGPELKEIEEEGVKVERIDQKHIENLNRKAWLEELVRHRDRVPVVFAEEKMIERFKRIKSRNWAYREILRIVKESEHLQLKRQVLYYVP